MDVQYLLLLIRKYLNGTATPEEHRFVEAWYREMDADRPIESILSTMEIQQLEQRIFDNVNERITISLAPTRPRRISIRWTAAAAVLLVIGVSSWFFLRYTHRTPEYASIYTERGKIRKVTLQDGSQVWLNADSRIKFAASFTGSGPREIYLEGEAFFDVAKDDKHPFLVHTRNLTTRVLGTKFNVNAYADKNPIEVSLLEGKVMLTAPSSNLVLAPHQTAVFADGSLALEKGDTASQTTAKTQTPAHPQTLIPGGAFAQSPDYAEDAAAWRDGSLIFHNVELENVLQSLKRKYNIQITADPTLLHQPVTADIGPRLNADEALLEITRQLRRTGISITPNTSQSVQYRKQDSIYHIE